MTPLQYKKIYDWFTARLAALTVLRALNRVLPLLPAAAYLALLALLGGRCAAAWPDRAALGFGLGALGMLL